MVYNIICTHENLEGEFRKIEMVLNSLFDLSYAVTEKTIYATNNFLKIKISKLGLATTMSIVDITLEKPSPKFKVKQGENKFEYDIKAYRSLGIDLLEF